MYPRQDNRNKDVQKELEAENKIQNDASNENLINSILNTGNENAGKLILEAETNGKDLLGSLNDVIKNPAQAPAEENGDKKEPADLNNIINEEKVQNNELAGGFLKAVQKGSKNESNKEYGKKDPSKNMFPGEEPAKQILYEDPADLHEKLEIQGNEEELDNEKLLDYSDDISMKNLGNKNKIKNHWRAGRKKDGDLAAADHTQERIAGLNIAVKKLDKRNKAGGFRRFLTNLAIFAGGTIGAALNWVGALFKRAFSSEYSKMYNRGQSNKKSVPEIKQKRRRHDVIPGWDGERFQKGAHGEDDILADFRRIPTVWSQLTAGQAEDKDGKPLAPKISIYVRQGKEAEDKSVNFTDPGHAGIGIEYSRYSLVSRRYERYNLRYGFYPGGQDTKQGSLSMTSDARIPGQLKGENFAAYTVRRSYPATAKQVNAILKASETYADKGYNSFTRNCTTFVKEMIVSEAGIPAGKQIFEQETPGFSSLINFALFAEKASENTAKASAEARYARLGTDPDMNYGGDENFRVNQQDYRNYKESLAKSKGGYIGKVDLPNVAAENMRRLEGEDTGNIGSRYHFGTARINPATQAASSKELSGDAPTKKPEIEPDNIRDAIINESNSLIRTILSVTRKWSVDELVRTPGIDRNVAVILKKISNYHLPLKQVKKLRNDPDKLRLARNNLENYVNDMNTLLFSFFKNDKRLHLPIMHMISLLEYGMYVVDFAYRDTDIGKNVGGDLRNLRGALNPLKSTGEAVPEAYERIAEGSAFRKKLLELIKQAINPDIDYSKGSAIIELD